MEPTTPTPGTSDVEDSSSDDAHFDCASCPHVFDTEDNRDRHFFSGDWYYCQDEFCPNRYNSQSNPPLDLEGQSVPRWAVHITHIQQYGREGIVPLPSPSDTPYNTPPVSPPPEPVTDWYPLSNQFPVDFSVYFPAPSLSISVSVDVPQEDYLDSSQFLLSIMGDVKIDSIPSLSSANQYTDWSAKMKGYFIFMGCWKVVGANPLIARPTPATDGSNVLQVDAWDKVEGQARGLLYLRVAQSFHHLLDEPVVDGTTTREKTSAEMWETLKSKLGKTDAADTWSKFEGLIGMERLSDQKPLTDQLNRLEARLKEITNAGLKLDENMKALLVLSKIPESYRTLISGLLSAIELKDLKVETVINKTLSEESVRKTGSVGSSASRVSNTKPKKKGPCGHCGGKSHNKSSCWKKYPDKKLKRGSTNKGKGKDNGPTHAHAANTTDNVASVLVTTTAAESSQSILTSFYGSATAIEGYNSTTWLMDLGASEHITFDMNDFTSYKPFDQPMLFSTAANGSNIYGQGSGTVKGRAHVDGQWIETELDNVIYVPQVACRLFATGSVERKGHTLVQGSG